MQVPFPNDRPGTHRQPEHDSRPGRITKRLRQQGWLVDLDGPSGHDRMEAGAMRATTGGLDGLVADGVKAGEIRIAGERRVA